MLDRMDPEVACKALEQFPELAHTMIEVAQQWRETAGQALNSNDESTKLVIGTINSVIDALKKQLDKEDISDEERRHIIDKMVELAKMANDKDTENKDFLIKVLGIVGTAVIAIGLVTVAALGVSTRGETSGDDDESGDDE